MDMDLKDKISILAQKYETLAFIEKDPSQFMHRFKEVNEQEIVAFIAANLAFGRRDQILKHVEMILADMKEKSFEPSQWIEKEAYKTFFTKGNSSFYRMFTHDSMVIFFDVIKKMIKENGSIGEYIKEHWKKQCHLPDSKIHLSQFIALCFPKECNLIPHTKESSCKRLNMFLRWMVRRNSDVDLGIWNWFDPKNLLMPLDVHVMQMSVKVGLLKPTSSGKIPAATMKNCILLTEKLKEVFPDDPVKADFALFSLGVEKA